MAGGLEREVHVWLLPDAQRRGDIAWGALSAEENAMADAFPTEALRLRYRVARNALRNLLSTYDDTPPEGWIFQRNRWGRPEIANGDTALRFSLSYGDGLTAIAVTRDAEVGVDIISTRRNLDVLGIADHAFAPSESADLHSTEAGTVRDRFFDYWALKEAYAKALGTGFWNKPRDFAFSFPATGAIGFRHGARTGRAKWQFLLASAPLKHRLAVAVGAGTRRPRRIVARVAPAGGPCSLSVMAQYPGDPDLE